MKPTKISKKYTEWEAFRTDIRAGKYTSPDDDKDCYNKAHATLSEIAELPSQTFDDVFCKVRAAWSDIRPDGVLDAIDDLSMSEYLIYQTMLDLERLCSDPFHYPLFTKRMQELKKIISVTEPGRLGAVIENKGEHGKFLTFSIPSDEQAGTSRVIMREQLRDDEVEPLRAFIERKFHGTEPKNPPLERAINEERIVGSQ